MSTNSLEKYVVLVSGAIGICTAFYFMRSRRKGKIFITKNVSIPKNKYDVNSSTGSTFSDIGEDGCTVSEEKGGYDISKISRSNSTSDEKLDNSEEQLNIGFGSDPSWTEKKARDSKLKAERKDILHTGHSKGGKLVVGLVGLPGSGKTYIARKVSRYLRWISYRTRVFSLAKYRLEKVGSKKASFFDPDNQLHYQMRVKLMMLAVSEAMKYLNRDGEIAIIDGTNYCRSRRDLIRERVSQEEGFEILWIESIISSGELLYVCSTGVIATYTCHKMPSAPALYVFGS
jgi:adenylylsulfate kinase-like enzyme